MNFLCQKLPFGKKNCIFLQNYLVMSKKSRTFACFFAAKRLSRVYIWAHEARLKRGGEPAESMETFN